MVKREVKELLPTMKIKADENEELDMPFKECQAEVIFIEDIETKNFGTKTKMTLEHDNDKFQVFINNASMGKLIEAYGDDDVAWVGKPVNLTKEVDSKYKTEMIVINPVK